MSYVEKPLVINPWNLDALQEIEEETDKRINPILQLRLHPRLIELKKRMLEAPAETKHEIVLTYVTRRAILSSNGQNLSGFCHLPP